jgi:hypothetical protein
LLQIPPSGHQQHSFNLKALKDSATLQSLPRLEFDVVAGGHRHRFHREVRFLEEMSTPYRRVAPVLDGRLADWEGVPSLKMVQSTKPGAELRACFDAANLYLGVAVPMAKAEEEEELGFRDDLQIGLARRLSDTDFGADFLRLGFSCTTPEAQNRTADRRTEGVVPGVKSTCRTEGGRTSYEIAVPLRLLKHLKSGTENHLILDLSFPLPDGGLDAIEPLDPNANTFAYRVRYGHDSLVPVHFIELTLEWKRP